jgi:hypothetical protein
VIGELKQDPLTGAVAVRTGNELDAQNAWAVMDPNTGGHWAPTAEVAEWVDVPGTPVAGGG